MLNPIAQVSDEDMMRRCFALAADSAKLGEYPYAAVIVRNGIIVAESINKVAHDRDVTRHAELVAICQAQETIGSTDLADCTIYANMEPCAFCSYAIRESRIAKVVYSMRSPIMGGSSRWNILGDPALSETMPEVFAPPPVVVAEFLPAEGGAALRKSAPLAWAYMISRGLLAKPSPQAASADPAHAGALRRTRRLGVAGWIMRVLRKNFFDRFGRGGVAREKRRPEG
ncbi:MAG TPA: nucleoside deaminase [Pseudolabrys sp.]|jgi:tRNA(adenine34) deaminase